MTEEQAAFVESMGQFMASTSNWTPMAGRMWAWLQICTPPEQTAAELAEALRASRGAISGTARALETARLVARARRRGDRREYFTIPPGAVEILLEGASLPLRRLREITERGLGLVADQSPRERSRLQGVHDLYAFFEREWPAILERYRQQSAAAERSFDRDHRTQSSPTPITVARADPADGHTASRGGQRPSER